MDNPPPTWTSAYPSTPPTTPPATPSPANRAPVPAEMANHLHALYEIQNMLRRQLSSRMEGTNASNSSNGVGSPSEHLSILIEPDGSPELTTNTQQQSSRTSSNNHNAGLNNTAESNIITEEMNTGARFDLQMVTKWLEQAFPFIFLLILVWIYEHRNGILVFIWMTGVFIHSNQAVKKQVALKDKRSAWVLTAIAGELTFHVLFIYFFFRSEELWRYLISLPPRRPLNIWLTFWVIIMNDFMVRFSTIIIKCFVIIVKGRTPPHKRNAQLYSVIEAASNTYRTMLPVSIWFKYMFNPNEVFSNLITLMYLLMKFNSMYEKVVQFFATLRAYVVREVQYGKYATSEQVMEVGDLCTICQEKMSSPIVLHCNHIFCEDCVSEWFERERTCPLCRANVPTAGSRTHSDGTTSLLVQLF